MSQAKLGTKCIDELIDYSFIIPSYQRGYRWSAVEVKVRSDRELCILAYLGCVDGARWPPAQHPASY